MKQIPTIQLQTGLFLFAIISTSLACSLTGQSLPKIINHPQPDLSIDHQIFESASCPLDSGFQRYNPESPLADLGCKMIRPAGDWEEVNRTKIYEDPEQDDLCVD